MEWKDKLITTNVDNLLDYLAEEGEASMEEAAEDLNVSEEIIESWTQSLVSAGLVKKRYSARQGTLLTVTDKEEAEKQAKAVRDKTREEIEEASEELDHEHKEVDRAKQTLKNLSKAIEENIAAEKDLKERFKELQEEEDHLKEEIDGKDDEIEEHILETIAGVEEQIQSIDEDKLLKRFRKRRKNIEENMEALRELNKHIERYEGGDGSGKEDDEEERGRSWECDECEKAFDSKRGLSIHQSAMHADDDEEENEAEGADEDSWECDICGDTFSSKRGLSVHVTAKHDKGDAGDGLFDRLRSRLFGNP